MARGTKAHVKTAKSASNAVPDKSDAATEQRPTIAVKPKPSHFKRSKGY